MTPKQFDKAVLKLFGPVLKQYGFTSEGSQFCTFHRKACEDIYHFMIPDIGSRGAWYDVKVFPASPLIDPLFTEQFPDGVGIPSDSFSYLSEHGIGLDQKRFNCKSEENFVNRFEKTVRRLLTDMAIPYLDRFQQLEDMIPVIKSPMFLGIALYNIGRIDEARPILVQQRERLAAIESTDRAVTSRLLYINDILQS